jgi:hypothetical protein
MTAHPESIVKMADRTSLRRIFDQAVPLVLLAVAGAGLVYAISIATTLQDLRALEPLTFDGHPDLELWRCQAAATASPGPGPAVEGEPKLSGVGASQQPSAAERSSARCPPGAGQVRPQ